MRHTVSKISGHFGHEWGRRGSPLILWENEALRGPKNLTAKKTNVKKQKKQYIDICVHIFLFPRFGPCPVWGHCWGQILIYIHSTVYESTESRSGHH